MPRKRKPLRWTLSLAAVEFGIDDQTLGGRLAGVEPGSDGQYSTQQVCKAIYGDVGQAKARKWSADAEMRVMQLEIQKGKWISTEEAEQGWSNVIFGLKRVVESANMPTESKDEFLRMLHAEIMELEQKQKAGQKPAGQKDETVK